MTSRFWTIVFLVLSISPTILAAGWGGSLSYFTDQSKSEGPTLGTSEGAVGANTLKVGYRTSNNLVFGGVYDAYTRTSGNSVSKRNSYGLLLGFRTGGWVADLSLYMASEYDRASGNDLSGGSGVGFDLGHNWSVSGSFFTGFQLSYKSFSYSQSGTASETNKIVSELYPALNFGFGF